MTTTFSVLVGSKLMESSQTVQYTAPTGTRVPIDKFTVSNNSASVAVFSVNLVTSGGTAGAGNLIMQTRAVSPGECYTCPELVGHILEPGGFISTLAGTASALVLRVSGRLVT
jgi:hypothetical protein